MLKLGVSEVCSGSECDACGRPYAINLQHPASRPEQIIDCGQTRACQGNAEKS